ncbi:DUF5017 domain-containing protein [Flavobacterium sp. CBA20B-1]|uniref:DUF5017 domain-containing protein n=1 Tax=unclassified Flavobacterium TaxID=196869 RepID=UPI0022252685|nr:MULTISPECIES: DUF5017 domain-containing protein [unclassified Flavobacterium]WCM41384.1 DUF5017 domain-containing protein [Flavobacterium sp. CBA20B-1]
MKKIKFLFPVAVIALVSVFAACSPEDEQELPTYSPTIYMEDFQKVIDGTFDESKFTNIAETGTKKWFSTSYQGNAYYEFSPFNSNETLNVAWFVTPAINVDTAVKKRLTFQSAQHHVVNVENNFLEVLISTDFTGDVTTATWKSVTFNGPKIGSGFNYDFFNSGVINLQEYTGNIYIAFKATGGTASANAGAYMIDNIKVF